MATTVSIEVPDLTVTTTATILSTQFVTVPLSTVTAPYFSYSPQSSSSAGLSLNLTSSTSTARSKSTSSTTQTFLPPLIPVDPTSSLPVSTTSSTSTSTSTPTSSSLSTSTSRPSTTTSSSTPSSTGTATPDSLIGDQSLNNQQKRAIVGGLSGSIAGLLFIALLIFLILRKKRNDRYPDSEKANSITDEGCRPAFLRTLTGLTGGKGSPKHISVTERPASPASVDEEHRIIRMSTRHWLRPFAPGAGEGYRETAPTGQLHVVNPDPSRPNTPSESPAAFLKRQRSGLTGFVFGAYKTPVQNYHGQISRPMVQHEIPHGFPTITVIDPNRSREGIARPQHARTPSFSSYPSVHSSPVRGSPERQPPQDDPFTQPPPSRGTRPSFSSTTTGGGASTAGWSSRLHPFRPPRSNIPESHYQSNYSNTTSRRSDPFDLDYRSVNSPRGMPQRSPMVPPPLFYQQRQQWERERERERERQRSQTPNWSVFPYNGT